MNIVVFTGEYHPIMNPISNCINQYLQVLKNNHNIDIVCPLNSIHFSPYISEKITVHYITNCFNTLRYTCIYYIQKGHYRWFWKFLYVLVVGHSVAISSFAFPTRHKWRKKKYENVFFELHKKKKFDCIITVSGWPCSHLAAVSIKKEIPTIRWITYTLDPYTDNPVLYRNILFKSLRRKRNYETEKSIYDAADYNIFTPELYKLAINKFMQPKSKTKCFPYILTEFEGSSIRTERDGEPIVAIYAGSLVKGIRSPEKMLTLFSKMPEFRLEIYSAGDCGDIINRYVSNNIKSTGLLSRDNYIKKICNGADVLINIGNINDLQSPSKFLELLSTGLPILNFYYKKDSNYYMTEVYPLGINISQEDDIDADIVRTFIKKVNGKRLSYDKIKDLYPENLLDNQLKQLEMMINC